MEKGFNSDIRIRGDLYHIQTEDWGLEAAVIVTRIFRNGAVIKSFRVSYSSQIMQSLTSEKRARIREALRVQHQKILDLLQNGQMLYEKSKINM